MNNRMDETRDSTGEESTSEAKLRKPTNRDEQTALGDLEPRSDVTGGSASGVYKSTDVTLKRGVID